MPLLLLGDDGVSPVVICEGETDATAIDAACWPAEGAVDDVPLYVGASYVGGANCAGLADYTAVKGRDVISWPDFDSPGIAASLAVRTACLEAGAESVRQVPNGTPGAADSPPDSIFEVLAATLDADAVDDPRPRLFFEPLRAALDVAEPDWIVPGLLARGVTSMLHAPPKTGKTLLHLGLAKAMLTGSEFLGLTIPRQRAVWLLSEQGEHSIGPQLRMMDYEPEDTAHLVAYAYKQRQTFGPEELADALAHAYQRAEIKPDVIVIDTLTRFVKLEDSSNYSEAGNALACVQHALAKMPETAALLVHHDRKAGGRGAEAVLGSTALAGGPDITIQLRRGDANMRGKVSIQSRLGTGALPDEPFDIELTLPGAVYQMMHGTDYETLQSGILDAVENGENTRKGIIAFLEANKYADVSSHTVSKATKNLVDSAELIPSGSTRSRRWHVAGD